MNVLDDSFIPVAKNYIKKLIGVKGRLQREQPVS